MGPLREVVLVIFALLFACTTSDEGPFERASAAMAKGDMKAVDAEIAALSTPYERDILRLRLATHDPKHGAHLCEGVTSPSEAAKCTQVVGRPHLQQVKP